MEVAVDRIDEDGEGGSGLKAASLPEREDSFHPTVSFVACGPKAPLAPHNGEADDPFGEVVGRRHPFFVEEDPKRIDFLQETAGKLARLILAVDVCGDQADDPGVEGPPLADIGWGMGHMAQALEFSRSPAAKGGDLFVVFLGQRLGVADQVESGKSA